MKLVYYYYSGIINWQTRLITMNIPKEIDEDVQFVWYNKEGGLTR